MGRKVKGKKEWLNRRCEEARENNEEDWNRLRRKKKTKPLEKCKQEKNKYTDICREERRNYKNDIIDKFKAQPKLFCRYINGKLKQKEEIEWLTVNRIRYDDVKDLLRVMNTPTVKGYLQGKVNLMSRKKLKQMEIT